jgi:hypothetical protein
VEAELQTHALPVLCNNNTFQSYVSIVYNKQMFKTASAQGVIGKAKPLWNHLLSDIDVLDPINDSIVITLLVS